MINNYTFKWVTQRITAIFLIPLSFWFIYQCISFQKLKYFELQIFFQSYVNSFLFTVMMVSMIIHAKLGCETIIQDYISSTSSKFFFKRLINLIALFLLFLVIVSIIKMNIYS